MHEKSPFHNDRGQTDLIKIQNLPEVLKNAPIGFFTSTPDGKFLSVNQNLAWMYGYDTPQELLDSITDVASQIYAEPEARDEFKRLLETYGQVVNYEYRLLHRDGSAYWVSTSAVAVRDNKENIIYYQGFTTHIDERRQKEDAFRQDRKRYLNAIIETTRDGFLLLDKKGLIIDVNNAFCRMSGYTREVLLHLHITDLATDATQSETEERVKRIEKKGAELFEAIFRRNDGSLFDVEISTTWLNMNGGESICFLRDITRRKQAEEELAGAYRMLESLTDTTHVMLACMDSHFNFRWVNRAYAEAGGKEPGEYIGLNHFDLYPYGENEAIFRKVVETGEPYEIRAKPFEYLDQPGRGVTYWDFRLEFIPDSTTGKGLLLFALTDVTEAERSKQELRDGEARLRALVENLPFEFWAMGTDGTCIIQNQLSQAASGDIVGKNPEAITTVDPELYRQFQANHKRAFAGEVVTEEVSCARNGQQCVFHRIIAPVWVGDKVRGILGINIDITDRKRMEKALVQLNDTLEEQIAERTRLAETRAQQLRFLTVQLVEAEEKERQRIAELLHDDLQQILASAKLHLQVVCHCLPAEPGLAKVDRLLKQSIDKSRQLSHELSPVVIHHSSLHTALEWLGKHMQDQFGLNVSLDAEAAHQFESNPMRVFIFRAVQELLFNVVKHSGVKVARVVLSPSDGGLDITVSDEGRGFNPGILDSSNGGSGLGLLSLRERIQTIGGNLIIESTPGQGSFFTLKVPLEIIDSGIDPQREGVTGEQVNTLIGTNDGNAVMDAMDAEGVRVVFVDDHKVMRQGLINLIAKQPGFQVVGEAANGREAIECVRQCMPDVVIMDALMPVMGGEEATRRIKAEWPDVRIIGLSMLEDDHLSQAMKRAGAEAFLTKTVSLVELLRAIHGIQKPGE